MCSKRKDSENGHVQSSAKCVRLRPKHSRCPTDGLPVDGPISEHAMNSLPNNRTELLDSDTNVEGSASEQETDRGGSSAERHSDVQPHSSRLESRSPASTSTSASDRDGFSIPLTCD